MTPSPIPAAQTVTVRGTGVADPTISATATVSLTPITVTAGPALVTLSSGQSQQFTSVVTGASNQGVTWSFGPAVGSISASGLYAAPASISSGQDITITATSVADPTKSAAAIARLIASAAPVTVTPTSVTLLASQTQQFTANQAATWSLSPAVGTITAAGVYTAPSSIPAAQTVTVRATGVADPTISATATVSLTPITQVESPTFSPPGGTYTGSVSVTISTATSGASIYYTLDGSTPTTGSPIVSGPITLTASSWLRAAAFKTGMPTSFGVEYFYTISGGGGGGGQVATPTFSPAGGTYTGSVSVTISTATSGATIYYTLDGSSPMMSSPIASGPITLTASSWLRACAVKTGMTASPGVEYFYTISGGGGGGGSQVATPTFSPAGGSYSGSVSVTISTATSGATIHYTLDGSSPTTSSPIASGPVTLTASSWLRANAFKTGMTTSFGVEYFYTIF